MARKKKHCVDYFPHDTQQSKSVRIISRQYGNDGYAFYYKLRELLGMAEMDLRRKMNNNNNNNRNSPTVRPSNNRTEVTAAPTTQSYMEPVVDYNNKCVDESLMYSAVGVLGSSFV